MDLQKEIIFGSAIASEARLISESEKAGKLRKIASKLYTTNLIDSPENIVRRNLFDILAWRLPGAVLSHRSGATLRPIKTMVALLKSNHIITNDLRILTEVRFHSFKQT